MKNELSQMMKSYLQLKENYKDCIVFYRLGDFYEMFFDDAILVSRLLDLTLTGRNCGLAERARARYVFRQVVLSRMCNNF